MPHFTVHDLRRTATTRCAEGGFPGFCPARRSIFVPALRFISFSKRTAISTSGLFVLKLSRYRARWHERCDRTDTGLAGTALGVNTLSGVERKMDCAHPHAR